MIDASSTSAISPQVFARQAVVLNKRGIQPQSMHMLPPGFTREWQNLRLHFSCDQIDSIWRCRDAGVEQPDHVVAGLAIRKHGLIRDVPAKVQWIRFFGACRESGSDEGSAVLNAV